MVARRSGGRLPCRERRSQEPQRGGTRGTHGHRRRGAVKGDAFRFSRTPASAGAVANAGAIPTATVRSALRTRRSNAPASDGSGELGSGELRSRPSARARVVGAALGSRRSARARAVGASLAETWHATTRALLPDDPRRYFPKRLEVVAGALVMRGERRDAPLGPPPSRRCREGESARGAQHVGLVPRVWRARGALRSSTGARGLLRAKENLEIPPTEAARREHCSVTGRGMTNSHDSHRHPHWF